MDQCHHPLVRPEADYLAHGGLLKTRGRPPVRREPACSSAEQHRVDRCSSRMQVLVVSVRVARQRGRGEHECGRTPELHRLLRACSRLDSRPRFRSQGAKAPRLRQMMVRREPGEVEEIAQRRLVERPGAVLLMRPPGADGIADVQVPGRYRPEAGWGACGDGPDQADSFGRAWFIGIPYGLARPGGAAQSRGHQPQVPLIPLPAGKGLVQWLEPDGYTG